MRAATLVCAPAGFGKTSLLADWARSGDRPVAWLSLDPGDNDPVRFWRYVAAALDRAGAAVSGRLGPLLRGPDPASPEAVVALLFGKLPLLGYEGAELTVRHPSAETFTLLADQLAGVERVTRAEAPGRPSLRLFEVDRRHRGHLLVVWDQRDSFTGEDQPPMPLDWPRPPPAASAVDAFGHAQPAELGDGRLRLQVSATHCSSPPPERTARPPRLALWPRPGPPPRLLPCHVACGAGRTTRRGPGSVSAAGRPWPNRPPAARSARR